MTILTVTLPVTMLRRGLLKRALKSVQTIARTIDANATETIWIAAAYLLANTVCQPLVAGLANVVGHKCLFIGGVLAFTAGSITCAVARNVAVMILGRTIQGVGGGSILSINLILLCKHVEPPYRPAYQGYMQLIFALGTNIAPIVGGAFASTHWRWYCVILLGRSCRPVLQRLTSSQGLLRQPALLWNCSCKSAFSTLERTADCIVQTALRN